MQGYQHAEGEPGFTKSMAAQGKGKEGQLSAKSGASVRGSPWQQDRQDEHQADQP